MRLFTIPLALGALAIGLLVSQPSPAAPFRRTLPPTPPTPPMVARPAMRIPSMVGFRSPLLRPTTFPNRLGALRSPFLRPTIFPDRRESLHLSHLLHSPWSMNSWSMNSPWALNSSGLANSAFTGGFGGSSLMSYPSAAGSPYLDSGSGYSSPSMQPSGDSNDYQSPSASASSPSTPAETPTQATPLVEVGIYDGAYEPKSITISRGTSVRWNNYGDHLHTVVSDTGLWDSREVNPGKTYGITFNEPGNYPYHCILHPEQMRGMIIVD